MGCLEDNDFCVVADIKYLIKEFDDEIILEDKIVLKKGSGEALRFANGFDIQGFCLTVQTVAAGMVIADYALKVFNWVQKNELTLVDDKRQKITSPVEGKKFLENKILKRFQNFC